MGKVRMARGDIVFIAVVMLLVGVILGTSFAPKSSQEGTKYAELQEERAVSMIMPAVDSEGNGVAGTLFTTVKPGSGKILLDTSSVLNYLDTQLSGRIAARAAGSYAKINLSNIDIIYTIRVNASIVEGPSAGASMAIAVLLALNNATDGNIAMTGTINPDGTIGQVGSIIEKAAAAKQHGASLFLVPKGQSQAEQTKREKVCNNVGSLKVCKINYNKQAIDIGPHVGIEVREVANIEEAYSYFTGNATTG